MIYLYLFIYMFIKYLFVKGTFSNYFIKNLLQI